MYFYKKEEHSAKKPKGTNEYLLELRKERIESIVKKSTAFRPFLLTRNMYQKDDFKVFSMRYTKKGTKLQRI